MEKKIKAKTPPFYSKCGSLLEPQEGKQVVLCRRCKADYNITGKIQNVFLIYLIRFILIQNHYYRF